MDEAATRLQLQEVMRDVFSDASIEIFDEMTAKDVDGWDSIAHISLVVAVEEQFKIRLSTAEVANLKDVGSLIKLIETKSAAR